MCCFESEFDCVWVGFFDVGVYVVVLVDEGEFDCCFRVFFFCLFDDF